jgi:hypothetical protein
MLKRTGLKQTEAFISSAVTLILLKKADWKRRCYYKTDNQNIATYADLSGYINTKRPNDKVDVTILRDGTVKHFRSLSKRYSAEFKGIELENIVPLIKEIQCKLWVKIYYKWKLNAIRNRIKGSIIISVDNTKAVNVETVSKLWIIKMKIKVLE